MQLSLINTNNTRLLVACIVFSLLNNFSIAQNNLVPNPSFEIYTQCPYLFNAPPPAPWYTNSNYSECYANACSSEACLQVPYNCSGADLSYQYARTGNAYIGLFYVNGNDARNYCQVKLKNSLETGKRYYAEYYVNLADGDIYGCNNRPLRQFILNQYFCCKMQQLDLLSYQNVFVCFYISLLRS